MDESSEIAKILRYILFGFSLLQVSLCQPLVNEPRQTVPFYNSEEVRSELAPSFSEHRDRDSFRPRFMQPNRDDLDPNHSLERSSGGHKGARQVHSPPSNNNGQTQQQERRGHSLSPLCSVFRMFIDPRRLSRCRNRNSDSFDREISSSNQPLPNNELNHDHEPGNNNNYANREEYHQHEERSRDSQDYNGGEQGRGQVEPGNNKRYDLLDDVQINHSGEEDGDENLHPGRMMMMMNHQDPTKVSQDRTMIVVPERSCPQGQRRDPRGYCRRLVKIRTNYQYGPPPGDSYKPIPIRYYYSRIVAIPTLHFFFPNV